MQTDDGPATRVRAWRRSSSWDHQGVLLWQWQEHRREFWALIAKGLSSEDAAMNVGVSPPVGFRWFRTAGGIAPSHLSPSCKPSSGRYLSFVEREEIALLRAEGFGVRKVACRLGRAPSTISRELRRNAATRGGNLDYRATTAQWHAERAANRPKAAKLATNPARRIEARADAVLADWPGVLVLSFQRSSFVTLHAPIRSCPAAWLAPTSGRPAKGFWLEPAGRVGRSKSVCTFQSLL